MIRVLSADANRGIAIVFAAVVTLVTLAATARHHFLTTRPGPSVMYLDALTPTTGSVRFNVDAYRVNGVPVPVRGTTLTVRYGSTLTIEGWALDNSARQPLAAVLVAVDGRRPFVAPSGLKRPDVAAAFGCADCAKSGFHVTLLPPDLPRGSHIVVVRYVLRDVAKYQDGTPLHVTVT